MSNDTKPPDAKPDPPDVLDIVEWMAALGDGMEFEAMSALRVDVDAGRVVLTDREKQILATAGAIIGNAAHAHAYRMFQKAMGAAVMGQIRAIRIPMPGGDDDDENGPPTGSKPS